MWRHFLSISSHSLLMLVLADFLKEVVQFYMQYECWQMSFMIIYVLITGTLLESQRCILVIAVHVMVWWTFSISDKIFFFQKSIQILSDFVWKKRVNLSPFHINQKSKPKDTLENSLTSFSSSQSKDLHEKINNTLPRNLRYSKNEISIIRHEESARIS